jgi:hypothetical protein
MRLTYKTGMGDYNTKESWANAQEFLIVFRKVVQRLGELEDEAEAIENEELSPLPFEEA